MGSKEKLGRDQIFHLLRSPVRRGIIQLLGDKTELSFTDLKKAFSEISVGTLYYHLDLLKLIVTQNPSRQYVLTEEGRKIFAEALRNEEAMIPVKASVSAPEGRGIAERVLFMNWLFSDISLRPRKYLAIPIAVFLVADFFALLSHSIQIFFFFVPVNGASALLVALSAAASLLGIYSLLNLLTFLVFRRREGNLSLLAATSVGLAPLLAYPLAMFAVTAIGARGLTTTDTLNLVLRVATQSFSLLLISAGLSQAKGLALYKSVLVTLMAIYANIPLLYFLGYVQA